MKIIGFPQIFCHKCGARAADAFAAIATGVVTVRFEHFKDCGEAVEIKFTLPAAWVFDVDIEG